MKRPLDEPGTRPALTPLIDIAFLVLIFFMALPLKALAHKLDQELPKRDGFSVTMDKPPARIHVRLRMRGDTVLYGLGDHVAYRPAGLERVLRGLGPDNIYEVHASPDVPWKAVVGMVNELVALKCEGVAFRGTRLPDARLRRMVPLPKPG